ncbi:MAG TPA: hypothetical protein VFB89_07085 [Gemmatimonadales bacterium]|nr:hypothetical protein [Gemmatimonadales bacterium]
MALASESAGQDSAAVHNTAWLRDRLFGDTNSAFKRLGYRTLSRLSQPVPPSTDTRWRRSPAVEIVVGGQQEMGLGLGLVYGPPVRPGPAPLRAEAKVLGRYGVTGSYDLRLQFLAPDLVAGWRFFLLAGAERMVRTPYFGPDNKEIVEDSLKERYSILYYRYALLRSTAFVAAQRHVAGPFWLHMAFQARHYRTNAIVEQPTLFAADVAAGRVDDTTRYTGFEGRLGFVTDSRDDWVAPKRGAYVEALVALGRLRDDTRGTARAYHRYLVGLREFMLLGGRGRTVLALRQRLVLPSNNLPYFLAYEHLTTGLPDDGVVGPRSIRLHGGGNQIASAQAFLSVDVRREAVVWRADPMNPVRLWGLLLADVGVLGEPDQSFSELRREWTIGLGGRAQLARRTLVGVDVGWTDTGPGVSVVSYFAY